MVKEAKRFPMTDLRIIRNSRRNGPSFLGVFGRFLKETLDDDRLVEKLAPEYFKYWDPNANRHSGASARMILKDFQNELLIIVKTADRSSSTAEMVVFLGKSIEVDVLSDMRELVSNRWSKGKLITQISQMNQMWPGLVGILKMNGWKQSLRSDFLEIDLMEK